MPILYVIATGDNQEDLRWNCPNALPVVADIEFPMVGLPFPAMSRKYRDVCGPICGNLQVA